MTIPQYLWYARVHPHARRCTDEERDEALTMLSGALQRGQLTVEEHAERVEAALHSKTVGDLVLLTRDLVAEPRPAAPEGAPTRLPQRMPDTALVWGLGGLVLFPLFVASAVAIVVGLVALGEVRIGAVPATLRPRAIGGLVAGLVGMLAGAAFWVFM